MFTPIDVYVSSAKKSYDTTYNGDLIVSSLNGFWRVNSMGQISLIVFNTSLYLLVSQRITLEEKIMKDLILFPMILFDMVQWQEQF